ncbi:RNA-binding protein [Burkholderia sp. Ac-20353]|uniref:RNA recognition motif domain-containing protein n=1 Tax=Burkholderia sp. Ac-20353 TaxID=2703894 RepID=UPI00197B2881|nr:RNA-binding protein [Burkholderia sp. Ac-20353]MBN3785775.1 RNA-binding protein [Burkholderia sp. Ac-20353]
MRIFVENLQPEVTREELQDFLSRYTGQQFTDIQFIGQTGLRPGALIDVDGANWSVLAEIRRRLDGMYWKRRRLGIWLFSFWDRVDAAEARRQREARTQPARSAPMTTLRR